MHTADAKNILITGTNSGFGRLAALSLAAKGHHVYATMRDVAGRNAAAAQELQAAAADLPGGVEVVEMSLASQAEVDAAVQGVLARAGHLDVVVNNAGYVAMGLAETVTDDQLLAQLDVNVVGPHRVLRAVLPGMRARRAGLLIHVSSELGRFILPAMGIYCASKAALESLADAYHYELKHLGIETVVIQPGAFPTGLPSRTAFGADAERAQGYGPMADILEKMGQAMATMLSGPSAPDPQMVADAIVAAVEGPRRARVVVDPMGTEGVDAVNEAHLALQRAYLTGIGMGDLA